MLSVLIRYTDGTFDSAPIGEPGVENLLQASALARSYAQSYGVVRASVFNLNERVSTFVAPDGALVE